MKILLHHSIYNFVQCLTLLPVNLMLLYRVINRPKHEYEVREKYTSYTQGLNILNYDPPEVHHKKKTDSDETKPYLESDRIDRAFRMYLGICILYYAADTFIKLYELRYPEDYSNICKQAYFWHHVLTVFAFKSIIVIDHYTWFLAGPMAYHTMVVAFP